MHFAHTHTHTICAFDGCANPGRQVTLATNFRMVEVEGKGKGKVHPRRGHEGPEGK